MSCPIFLSLSAILSRNAKFAAVLKSGRIMPDPPPPSPLNLLISSNDASCLLADFAAPPTPLYAFFWSFRDFAALALSFAVVPNSEDTIFAINETTVASTLTSAVNAGIMICTSGCASVSSAPLSCAIASRASPFTATTSASQSRMAANARAMMVKTSARFASIFTRFVNASMPLDALSNPSCIFPAFLPVLPSCLPNSPAFAFIRSSSASPSRIEAFCLSSLSFMAFHSFSIDATAASCCLIASLVKNSPPPFICASLAFASSSCAPKLLAWLNKVSRADFLLVSFSCSASIFFSSALSSFCACLSSISALMITEPSAFAIQSPTLLYVHPLMISSSVSEYRRLMSIASRFLR